MQRRARQYRLTWILLSGLLSGTAFSVTVSKDSILPLIFDGSRKLKAAEGEWRASLEALGNLTRSFMPSVVVKGHHEKTVGEVIGMARDPIISFEVSSNLYNARQDQIASEINGLESERLRIQSYRTAMDELAKAQEVYWEVIYLREKKNLILEMIALNKRNLKSALNRIRNGVATQSDRFEFEMQIIDLQRGLSMTELDMRSNEDLLGLLLGISDQEDLTIVGKLEHSHDGMESLEQAQLTPGILFREYEIIGKQYSLAARAMRQSWQPKIDLFASYSHFDRKDVKSLSSFQSLSRESDVGETAVGVRLSMDFKVASNSFYEADAYKKRAEAAIIRAGFAELEVNYHLGRELGRLKVIHDQVHDAAENITRAEDYYKMTSAEYDRGAKNSPDVLGAAIKMQEIHERYLDLLKDYEVTRDHVDIKTGKIKFDDLMK